jgi:amino acid adenylation domain-containing protein
LYINMLPLRTKVSAERDVVEWLTELQTGHSAAREYQYDSLSKLQQRYTDVTGDWFDSIIVFENYPVSELLASESTREDGHGLKLLAASTRQESNYVLTIIVQVAKEITIEFIYNSELLQEEYVEAMKGHFEQVLMSIGNEQQTRVGELNCLSRAEEQRLVSFNKTEVAFPDKTVIDLFEEQVGRTPDAVAVVYEGKELSYGELNERANRLAHHLRQTYGVGREDRVGVQLKRSDRLMVALLGVLKAGAAYVPIDVDYPEERKQFMVIDSGCKVLIDHSWPEGSEADGSPEDLETTIDGSDLAYVIYTSGSTGRPKGVLVEHRGLVNVCLEHIAVLSFQPEDRYLQFMAVVFDGSILDMFSTWLSGAALILPTAATLGDRKMFLDLIAEQRVSVMTLTPSYLSMLGKAALESVHTILSAGEAVQREDALYYGADRNFYNAYGPSEGTINTTLYKVEGTNEERRSIPIGRPGRNKRVYILDSQMGLCPVGVGGELYIGGAGVARGYLNRPELTAEKFVDSPFLKGERLYRTGDLGRWRPDGNIEFLGRKDEQVKVRGYRIELGEIESVLSGQPGVKGCCVVAREGRLLGYVVMEGGLDRAELEAGLNKVLPEYMVPRVWVELEALPLTSNGKIDRKALPDVSGLPGRDYVAPRSAVEVELTAMWSELLEIERVGIRDNFFELGGHSLLATRLIAMVHRQLNAELAIRDVFDHPTIEELALLINEMMTKAESEDTDDFQFTFEI